MVVGRESEVGDVGRFLVGSEARALLLEGPAGVGKTTVWRAAIDEASRLEHTVLITRPLETETSVSFSGLTDLLGGLFDAQGDALPAPQRDALGAALLRTSPGDATAGAVSAGTLRLLRTAAQDRPVLVAVDDLQWLDPPTAAALRFALRRCDGDPVRLLATARTGVREVAVVDEGLRRLVVGPLGLDALARIVADELGHPLSRPALQRIERLAGGNAFIALELARAEAGAATADGVLRSDQVRRLVGDRLGRLPAATQTAIATVAALARPRVDGIAVAVGDLSVLDPAFEAGVLVEGGDEIRFSHPLLAEAAIRGLPPGRRRGVHARLAELAEDAEERGRHLAAATLAPDAAVAAVVDEGAVAASGRGAPAAAAELLEEAVRLTPPSDLPDRDERLLRAGKLHLQSGDAGRAIVFFRRALDDGPAGSLRARVLMAIATHEQTGSVAGSALAQEALDACGDDADARVRILLDVAVLHFVAGYRITRAPVEEALDLLESVPDRDLRAWALCVLGQLDAFSHGGGRGAFREAMALETARPTTAVYDRPAMWLGCAHLWADEVDAARALLSEMRATAEVNGDEVSVSGVDLHLTELECRAGDLEAARMYSDEAMATIEYEAEDRGLGATLYARSLAATHRGDAALARELAARGLAIAARFEDHVFALQHHSVLGFLELSLGHLPQAVAELADMPAELDQMGVGEPGVFLCHADLIEALIGIGEHEEAESRLEQWESLGRAIDRPRVHCTAARARGLLCAARGDLPRALGHVECALEMHDRLPVPLERGRTLLALGALQRRVRRRRAARATLDEARALFADLGARIWEERARVECDRISGRAPGDRDELTPTERRVAELVAEGRSNREVAQELFVTVRTVESNLTRVYAKLGVRSRAELAARRAV
jgi:DNA-binding CsgD family transcriptional regulator